MCDVYAGVDTVIYAKESRSLRLHGHVTSLSLEQRFWKILERMAAEEGVTLVTFITTLYDEVVQRYGEAANFTSLLRVACTTYLIKKISATEQSGQEAPFWVAAS